MEDNYNEQNMGENLEQNKMKGMSNLSPEEARQKAKETVAKGVALGSGAMEGYVQNLEPKVAGDAARVAAQTVKGTVDAVKEELPERKSSMASGDIGMSGMSGSESGGRFSEATSAAKEKISGQASHLREQASIKSQELKERSKEGFQHMKQEMKEHSADEIREKARDTVGRQIAKGTGALEGYVEQADPELPKQVVHKTGEVVREAASAIKEEVKGSKSSDSISSTTSDTTSSGGI